jgi:hypothetical protein
MKSELYITSRRLLSLALFIFTCFALPISTTAQNETTGAFQGEISDVTTGAPIAGARVQFTYSVNGVQNAKITDSNGRFYQGLLGPGIYSITISKQGYKTQALERVVLATRSNTIIPIPVKLEPESPAAPPPTTPTATAEPTPSPTPTPEKTEISSDQEGVSAEINATDGRRGGAFTDKEVSTLPLGGTTLVRTFDELALLLPGVALPPQTLGSIAGPGVGAGVGSAGQFSVNGLRSRANISQLTAQTTTTKTSASAVKASSNLSRSRLNQFKNTRSPVCSRQHNTGEISAHRSMPTPSRAAPICTGRFTASSTQAS